MAWGTTHRHICSDCDIDEPIEVFRPHIQAFYLYPIHTGGLGKADDKVCNLSGSSSYKTQISSWLLLPKLQPHKRRDCLILYLPSWRSCLPWPHRTSGVSTRNWIACHWLSRRSYSTLELWICKEVWDWLCHILQFLYVGIASLERASSSWFLQNPS